jgi:hypothetical protein
MGIQMSSNKKKKSRFQNGTSYKAKRSISTKPVPWGGDHGTGTAAATAGTKIVGLDGPNNMGQRVHMCAIDELTSLTMRQSQAAHAIREAYGRVEMLSSGGPLKEQVDSTPKPDATIAVQMDAQSRLVECTRAILRSERSLVDGICYVNIPIGVMARQGHVRPLARFAQSMDRVADALGY